MKRWQRVSALLLAMLLVLSAGCTSAPAADQGSGGQQKATAGFPVEVKDDTGQQVTVKEEPKRIVSLLPSMTETVYALDRGDRVVGVTTNDTYPKAVKRVEKVGDMKINAEKVVSLKPDLVLTSPGMNGQETIDQLRKLGLTVIALEPKNLEEVFEQIQTVGKATGAEEEADQLVQKMKRERALAKKVASQVPKDRRAKVWVEVSPDLFTAGNHTFMNELISLAGGDNVAKEQEGWVQVSSEKVVKWNPDVILYTYRDKPEAITSRGGWKSIEAVKEGRIQSLPTDIVSRPGPRITQGLLDITKAIYPETYADVVK